ncbi:MAG: hypothetical protein LBN41_09660 [Enterobacteriaceae bacterium]|jgi:hypothetical protein|nr:hypothetical protein [Enterobacteriaceae bacterium]
MPIVDDLPDLTHWRTVQEFSIEQAAMLLAGIDPYEYEGLRELKAEKPPRWKMAYGFADGMVSAIRRGTLTPILCIGEDERGYCYECETRLDNRAIDICKDRTIITRTSLLLWGKSEKIDFARSPKSIPVIKQYHSDNNQSYPQLLPAIEHRSEGLDFVNEAIEQFWSTYDEEDPDTAPKGEEVRSHLISKGCTVNLARSVDEVLRPFSLKKGGRKSGKSNK